MELELLVRERAEYRAESSYSHLAYSVNTGSKLTISVYVVMGQTFKHHFIEHQTNSNIIFKTSNELERGRTPYFWLRTNEHRT